jgi:hypothetical protein
MKSLLILLASALVLSACAVDSVPKPPLEMPAAVKDPAPAAPSLISACGNGDAEVLHAAAASTIKSGYDKFIVLELDYKKKGGVLLGASRIVKMFKADDPAAAKAVDAKQVLGVAWADEIKKTRPVC